jgi:UDP-N-acetylmuramyl pentapeptide phosphotransferase/UDP-N-acetylglucosamine-1-phosphate transferase
MSIDQQGIAIMALILGMACLAFWLFDFYPAKMLMGDTGSMFLGYFLAVLAIFSGAKVGDGFFGNGLPDFGCYLDGSCAEFWLGIHLLREI